VDLLSREKPTGGGGGGGNGGRGGPAGLVEIRALIGESAVSKISIHHIKVISLKISTQKSR